MSRQRFLITGATGYLAHRLLPVASGFAEVFACARNVSNLAAEFNPLVLDVTDESSVRSVVEQVRPDAVIHAAASNPGSSQNSMDGVNHLGAKHIAKACTESGCRLVAVSTDVVFAGDAAPYADSAVASPLPQNEYGRTKALGEQAIVTHCPPAVIVRTSLIYGLEQMDRGTAGFVERLARGEDLNLFSDVLRQPVWVDSLALALCRFATDLKDQRGFINVAGSDVLSRADFGLRLLDYWDARPESGINLISGKGIGGLPMDLRVSLDRALSLGIEVPGVEEVLDGAS